MEKRATHLFAEKGFLSDQRIRVAVLFDSKRPVVGHEDVRGRAAAFKLQQPRDVVLSNMVHGPDRTVVVRHSLVMACDDSTSRQSSLSLRGRDAEASAPFFQSPLFQIPLAPAILSQPSIKRQPAKPKK